MTPIKTHRTVCSIFILLPLSFGASCSSPQSPAGDNSALYVAIHKADLAEVRTLLDRGANPNSTIVRQGILERFTRYNSKSPPAPLVVAILEKQPEIVKVLLEKGAKVNFQDAAGFTPLEHAMSDGNPDIIGALLQSGADAKMESKFGFPLVFEAACRGKDEALKLLLSSGADVNNSDSIGAAGQHYVGSLESAYERLVGRSSPKTRPGATLLMLAAQMGHTGVVKLLIDRGADLNARDSAGRTALMLVVEEGLGATTGKPMEISRLLLSSGADVSVRDNNGDSALMRAKKFAGFSVFHEEVVRMLQAAGATD